MSKTWEEMRKSKEEEFFEKQNREKLRKLLEGSVGPGGKPQDQKSDQPLPEPEKGGNRK